MTDQKSNSKSKSNYGMQGARLRLRLLFCNSEMIRNTERGEQE
jgi:hypothetical protein